MLQGENMNSTSATRLVASLLLINTFLIASCSSPGEIIASSSPRAPSGSSCRSDMDCEGALHCQSGICMTSYAGQSSIYVTQPSAYTAQGMQSPPSTSYSSSGPSCRSDLDCPGALHCQSGSCTS